MSHHKYVIDIKNLSTKDKETLQLAFFKLGYGWVSSGAEIIDISDDYTRIVSVPYYSAIAYSNDKQLKPTHTLEEFLELAGVKENTETPENTGRPDFNLEAALRGAPVTNRRGIPVTSLTQLPVQNPKESYSLVGVMEGELVTFGIDGLFLVGGPSHTNDLIMEPSTRTINGIEVPRPVSEIEIEHLNYCYIMYLANPNHFMRIDLSKTNCGSREFQTALARGLIFKSEEDLEANFKAFLSFPK